MCFILETWRYVMLCRHNVCCRSCFTSGLWADNWNLENILHALILILMVQSGHNFAHATTAELLWHVQYCDAQLMIISHAKATYSIFLWDLADKLMNSLWNGPLAPVPLTIIRLNSEFNQNLKCSSFKYTWPITATFCTRYDNYTVVTCAGFHCDQ